MINFNNGAISQKNRYENYFKKKSSGKYPPKANPKAHQNHQKKKKT
jgi:hypothetical protein